MARSAVKRTEAKNGEDCTRINSAIFKQGVQRAEFSE